jgi:hypothetical protein
MKLMCSELPASARQCCVAGCVLVAALAAFAVYARHVNPDKFDFIPDQGWGDWSGVVTGRIIDENGNPVANARVRVWGKDIATTTDRNGFFTVRGLQQGGHYSLAVDARGYEDTLLRWIPIPRFQSADIGDYHLDEEVFETNYWVVVSNLVAAGEWVVSSNMVDIIGDATNTWTAYQWTVLVETTATETVTVVTNAHALIHERPDLALPPEEGGTPVPANSEE